MRLVRFAIPLAMIAAIPVTIGVTAGSAAPDEPCKSMSRACLIEIAQGYMRAQFDYSERQNIRLAPNAKRWENGLLHGSNAQEIRRGEDVPQELVAGKDLDRAWVDGNEVIVFWRAFFKLPPDVPGGNTIISTAHIAERFKIEQGVCGTGISPCITEIEARYCISNRGEEVAMPSSRPPATNIFCERAG